MPAPRTPSSTTTAVTEHNDGDWLVEQFEVLRSTDAGKLLFDHEHNPMYWVPISPLTEAEPGLLDGDHGAAAELFVDEVGRALIE